MLFLVSGLWLARGEVLLEGEEWASLRSPLVPCVGILLPRSSRRSRLELALPLGEFTALRLMLQLTKAKGVEGVDIDKPIRFQTTIEHMQRCETSTWHQGTTNKYSVITFDRDTKDRPISRILGSP